jgi:hypothetical protein
MAYGIIDSDYHTEQRLDKLKTDKVFSLKLAEVENLFLEEKLLEIMAEVFFSQHKVDGIKTEILKQLEKEKELQALRFVSNRINNVFNESHIQKANSLVRLTENYTAFNNLIEIDSWYRLRLARIEEIVAEKDYRGAISIFNNKGLKEIVMRNFSKGDYIDYVVKYVDTNEAAMNVIKGLLPSELMLT